MAKAKIVHTPYEALREEVLTVAREFGAARVALAAICAEVAKHKNESKVWAPDLAEPTARYTLAKDHYDAICGLLVVAGQSNSADLTKYGPYVTARACYDAAYAS